MTGADVQESVVNSPHQDTSPEARSDAGRDYTSDESALRNAVRADIARSGADSSLSSQTIEDLQNAVARETDQSHAAGAQWGDQYHG